MKTYRTKQLTVHATQWHQFGDHFGVVRFVDANGKARCEMGETCDHCNQPPEVHAWLPGYPQGQLVCPGDYIVASPAGRLSVYGPMLFAALHEEVPTPAKFGGMELTHAWLDELVDDEPGVDLVLTGTMSHTIAIDPAAEEEKNRAMRRMLNRLTTLSACNKPHTPEL